MTTSFRLDREFAGIGRINVVSGAATKVEHQTRNAMLTDLFKVGNYEVLRALRAGELTVGEVYNDKLLGRLEFTLERTTLRKPLWARVAEWIPSSAAAPASRARYASAFKFLQSTGVLREGATVADLERVDWPALHNRGLIGPAGWNRVRSSISAFLTSVLHDKFHPFRRAVMARLGPPDEEQERTHDLPPELFWRIVGHIREPLRACYVTMVAAGLGPKEYVCCEVSDLNDEACVLMVPGHKKGRKGKSPVPFSADTWPWVKAAVPCPVSKDVLADHWKKACRKVGRPELVLYDLRHCFGQWLANAGVPESVIQVGLRHRSAAMTRRYTKQLNKGQTAAVMGKMLALPVPEASVA